MLPDYVAVRRAKVDAAYRKRRLLILANGGSTSLVESDKVAQHIRRLMDLGWSCQALSQATNGAVSDTTLMNLTNGTYRQVARSTRAAAFELPYTAAPNHHVDPTAFIPNLGAQRRAQALLALGWTHTHIKEHWPAYTQHIARGSYQRIRADRWRHLDDVYQQFCMTRGPSAITSQRALTAGFVPPLAWVDIDDPDERPTDWAYRPERSTRAEALTQLDDVAAGISEACRRLRITKQSLQKWCGNNGMSDLYNRMSERETPDRAYNNQHTAGRAA